MSVDIDEARHDQLAACINSLDSAAVEVGRDGYYVTPCNRDIPYSVQPTRGINYTTTSDNQIVFSRLGRECTRYSGDRSHGDACVEKLPAVHIGTL